MPTPGSGGAFGEEKDLDLREEFEREELDGLEGELARERRRGRGLFDEFDPELAEQIRVDRSREISQLRFRTLVARGLYPHDRPGPHSLTSRSGSADPGWAEKELPGSLWLPLPGVSGWEGQVENALAGHMSRWRIEKVPIDFMLGLGLDLAVQGERNGGKDLDNLAHLVTGAVRRVVGVNDEDPVTIYRVYSRPGERDGVRVRMVDARLLEAVHAKVFDSRYLRLQIDDD